MRDTMCDPDGFVLTASCRGGRGSTKPVAICCGLAGPSTGRLLSDLSGKEKKLSNPRGFLVLGLVSFILFSGGGSVIRVARFGGEGRGNLKKPHRL